MAQLPNEETPKEAKWEEIGIIMQGRKYNEKLGECDCQDAFECDYCGYQVFIKSNYCPNCGAYMGEQKPRGVIYSGNGYADGREVYDLANCPACNFTYEEGDKDWGEPFCPHCGQPLIWDIEKAE